MKKLAWLLLLSVFQVLICSCDINSFSAGSYAYAENVYSGCKGDTIINRLKRLKASGVYDNASSYPDGPNEPPSPYYSFYFFSRENNCILLTAVPTGGFNKESALLLVSVKGPNPTSKWQDFNHGLDKKQQERITDWFNKKIKPAISCD
ncbi:hypothetical protein [Hymenobacter terricola]|uniref:hypothetical protein n=1 Tax=Hymenobacter terricola TaxID=2819236 RepID=UPI001B30DB71|nr:hypothetical protein [Hymenobacter terricola]